MEVRGELSAGTTRARSVCEWSVLALLLALMGYLCFVNLGTLGFADYDEARHGVNAYEMVQSGDYIVSTFAGETDYWNLKPPLSFWAIALGYKLFGYNALGLRFFGALSMLVCTVCLCVWLKKRVGFVAALTCILLIVCNFRMFGNHFTRFGDADAQYQCFFTLSMLCLLQSRKRFAWLYGCALCFALAFLEKSYHAALIPLICLMDFAWERRWRELTVKRVLGLLACGLLPVAAWAIARYSRDGMAFLKAMFSTDVTERIGSEPPKGQERGFAMYFGMYMQLPMLALAAGVSALCFGHRLLNRAKPADDQRGIQRICLLWALVPPLFYSLLNVSFIWYAYSALLALPALAGTLADAAWRTRKQRPLLLVCACAALSLCVYQVIPTINRLTYQEMGYPNQAALLDTLDREDYAGYHMYVQYNETRKGKHITDWMPADRLAAMLYGDVICLPGGAEAFEADEEYALLLIARRENAAIVDELQSSYMWLFGSNSLDIYSN